MHYLKSIYDQIKLKTYLLGMLSGTPLEHHKIMLPFSEEMTSGKNDLGQKPRTTSVMPARAFKFLKKKNFTQK